MLTSKSPENGKDSGVEGDEDAGWGVLSGAPLALPRATPPALLLPPTNLTMTHHTSLA